MARKAKARKCSAEVAGNVQAKVERQHRHLISFSVIPPSRSIPQRVRVRVTQLYPPARAVELIRPSIPVMTHSLESCGQKGKGKKVLG